MDLEQRLRAGLAAPDPGAKFTDAVMARARQALAGRAVRAGSGSRNRLRHRFIVIGTVAALAVAAAMLALLWPGAPDSIAEEVASAPQVESPQSPALPAEAEPVEVTAPPPPAAKDATPGFTVAVLPLRHLSRDASGRPLLEAFHAALIAELRKVPGLVLRLEETVDPAVERDADYLLTVASVAETDTPSGGLVARSTDGISFAVGSVASGLGLQAEIIVQPTAGRPRPVPYNVMFPLPNADDANQRMRCERLPEPFRERLCTSATKQAVLQVEALRARIFPPDPSWQGSLVARLGDTTRTDRGDVLLALLSMRERGLPLDAAAIDLIVGYIADAPAEQRATYLRRLSTSAGAEFLPPLLDVLRRHPDEKVRLDLLMMVAANHGADPRVRSTLAALMQDDSPPTLRMAARRMLTGEAEWNRHVVATLQDPDLPLEARLEPLQLTTRWTAPAEAAGMAPLVNDKQVVDALVGMAREGLTATGQAATTRQVFEPLKDIEIPAVNELFLQLAKDRNSPNRGSFVFAMAAWMVRHEDDPEVRRILEEGAARSGIPPDLFSTPR